MGGGALQVGDLRLLEDGGERGGALGPDVVVVETADEGGAEMKREQACQRALTQKQTLGVLVRAPGSLLERLQHGVAL